MIPRVFRAPSGADPSSVGSASGMAEGLLSQPPHVLPPLHPEFRPAWLGNRAFRAEAVRAGGVRLVLALERDAGNVSIFDTLVLPDGHAEAACNLRYAERVLKFLLWQKGAFRVSVAGPRAIAEHQREYAVAARAHSMPSSSPRSMSSLASSSRRSPLLTCPRRKSSAKPVGRHLDGCRIGFDAGGSDRKVAAVINGKEVFSTETVLSQGDERTPSTTLTASTTAFAAQAAAHLPRIDAIGVSSAGIYVNNRTMIASLFRKVPKAQFEKIIKPIYLDIAKKWGNVPIEVANDGDVTALAGAMSLKRSTQVLGIAMGTCARPWATWTRAATSPAG